MTTGRSSMAAVSALIFMILLIACITGVTQYGRSMVEQKSNTTVNAESTILKSTTTFGSNRKLLFHRDVIGALSAGAAAQVNRIWGDECSKADIVINQGPTDPLPNGIPTYTVEIMNVCTTGCDISGIHMSCGWFSSARLINPRVFKRLRYNDCLVNDGKPLVNGRTISFQYANTFPYPLFISSVVC